MKLNKDQIEFIDNYLIKNKVKFWDVRLELLDHIAIDIQNRMEKGLCFEEALEMVHLSFGNKIQSKKLSKDQKRWIFSKSIYSDNSGYKKLILNKQKQWNKQLTRLHWKELKTLYRTPVFLVVYFMLGLVLFNLIQSNIDHKMLKRIVLIPFLVLACIPLFMSLNYFKKVHRNSLHLKLLGTLPLMGTTIFNFFIYIPKIFGQNNGENIDSWVLLSLYVIGVPLILSSIILYKNQLKKYQNLYLKWKTVN